MNITEYIKRHWNNRTGLSVTVRRADGRTFNLSVPSHNRWDVWAWSKTRLVMRGNGKTGDPSDYIMEGWDRVEGTTIVEYLRDFEPVIAAAKGGAQAP